MHKAVVKAFLFVGLIAPVLPAATGAELSDIASQYHMLEWVDLVPEGWEPPLIPPGHDSAESTQVPVEAVVAKLDRQTVTLPGFMKPLVFEGNEVFKFLLVPFLPHHTKQHAHLDANQMVHVSLLEPVIVDKPLAPIWVIGTITVDAVLTEEGPAAYSIGDAVMTEYKY